MVVGDDHLQPLVLGPGHLRGVADAAIHRDHEPGLRRQLFEALDLEAVTLGQPVGDVGEAGEAQFPQELVQHGGGGDAVGVVVAVDGHRLPLAHRLAQAGGGDFQVRQPEGGIQALQGGVQKGQDVVRGGQTAVQQDAGHQPGAARGGRMTAATNSGLLRVHLPGLLAAQLNSFQALSQFSVVSVKAHAVATGHRN